MGISAAVVYYVWKKTTVALRTSESSHNQRYEDLDTAAFFAALRVGSLYRSNFDRGERPQQGQHSKNK